MKGFLNKFFGPHAAQVPDPKPHLLVPLSTENLYDNQRRALIGWVANRMGHKLQLDRLQSGSLIYLSFIHADKEADDAEVKSAEDNRYLLTLASQLVSWMLKDEDVYLKIKELKLADKYHRCLLEIYEEIKPEFYRYLAKEKQAETTPKSVEDQIWQVYRDVIYAATQRRFLLITKSEVDGYRKGNVICQVSIADRSDIPKAREQAKLALQQLGIQPTELMSYLLVISEAITNILKHAREGKLLIVDAGSVLHIIVEDIGPGFPLKILPNTVLMAGYSTKKSLGQGFTLMLRMADSVLLSTVPNEGSCLILIFKRLVKEDGQVVSKHSTG